jgi:hypothetical protein
MKFIAAWRVVMILAIFSLPVFTHAATLRLSPETGVYTVGKNIPVSVLINTEGKSVNASDGQISFNPRELQVVSVSRTNSIYNLWTEEPTYSNTAGTISFGGGSPSGYKGASGAVISIIFRPLSAGTPKIQFQSGSILAADGLGTNVLTSMSGATYTVSAPAQSPEPEYITPPNTPPAPIVTSGTHSDESRWYRESLVSLSWEVPAGVVAVRTLIDTEKNSIPSVVYDDRVSEKTISDLPQGTSYFHIQFKNTEGWGKIAHFRINVDSEEPRNLTVTDQVSENAGEIIALLFQAEDISPIVRYKIQLDGKDPFDFDDTEQLKRYGFSDMQPGYHTVSVEAFDSAGNTTITTHSFTLEAIPKPEFIEFPTRINTDVIPAIKGKTVPRAKIAITVRRASDGALITPVYGNDGGSEFMIESDDRGEFIYIPKSAFERGVYDILAVAKDEKGRLSEMSDPIRIIVDAPGYIIIGTLVINTLSVLVPLAALMIVATFGLWYLSHKLRIWKRRVSQETTEAEQKLTKEFDLLVSDLHEKVSLLKDSRKGKLTRAELDLIEQMEHDLIRARANISKEIVDIEKVIS